MVFGAVYEEEKPKRKRGKPNPVAVGLGSRMVKTEEHKQRIRESMEKYWNKVRKSGR